MPVLQRYNKEVDLQCPSLDLLWSRWSHSPAGGARQGFHSPSLLFIILNHIIGLVCLSQDLIRKDLFDFQQSQLDGNFKLKGFSQHIWKWFWLKLVSGCMVTTWGVFLPPRGRREVWAASQASWAQELGGPEPGAALWGFHSFLYPDHTSCWWHVNPVTTMFSVHGTWASLALLKL